MLFEEIIVVYSKIRTKYKIKNELLIVEADGTYSYHWALKG
jgi:hypothetical protein